MSNYSKYDVFYPLALVKEKNSLFDIVGGKVAVNNGATKTAEGFDFDGINDYIDTNYNPSAANKYNLNDSNAGAFYIDNGLTVEGSLYGITEGLGDAVHSTVSTTSQAFAGNKNTSVVFNTPPANKIYIEVILDPINGLRLINDGVSVAASGSYTPEVVPNGDYFIGAKQDGSNNPIEPLKGILSMFQAGKGEGVDIAARNTNIRQLLTDLGLNLGAVENKLAGETITDTLEANSPSDELKGS